MVSVLIAALTAFAFAIYPAWVAAGLKPADALRAWLVEQAGHHGEDDPRRRQHGG